MAEELNPRQTAFVTEYLIDLNATQAAIRAGYSENTAQRIGSENLSKPLIAAAVEKAFASRVEKTGVTAERVINEIAKSGFSDLRKMFNEDGSIKPPSEWDDAMAGSIASIEHETSKAPDGDIIRVAKIKLWDKGKALDQLARHLSLYHDKLDVTVTTDLAKRLETARARKA